ncbi:uncharacterized protein LOC121382147 [Gigantopelta aegis]|uniref:uncharacterized protein LOC121382147 n=1 Tax=Gigantopelta aegis TaxID=1735272 RepID=UPI001B88C461|nr:uncharacterized protein LOC121382147 [Gigantopelta aegis]
MPLALTRAPSVTSTKDSAISLTNESTNIYSTNCFLNSSFPLWSSLPAGLMQLLNNVTDNFRETWQFQARVLRMSGSGVTFALRASNPMDFSDFVSAFHEGTILQRMAHTDTCDRQTNTDCLCTTFVMHKDDVVQYKDIHLSFQELRVCSVDFTTVNHANIYFVLMFVFSTAVAPYLMVFALCAVTCCRLDMMAYGFSKEDWMRTRRTFFGCLISVCFYVPYFVVNLMNSRGLFVSPHCHIIAMVMYYCCALIPCVFCLQVSCLRYPSSVVDTRSVYHENADIELLQLNRV